MIWLVHSTLVCPYTGTAFSSIQSLKNLRLVIWYNPNPLLRSGDIMHSCKNGFVINREYHPFSVYKINPYSKEWWQVLQSKLACPCNSDPNKESCTFSGKCYCSVCPYGLRKSPVH
ncbi:hypothetical protein J0B02_10715 [Enterobacteriaceae bacterium YMB-R22]|jgi:hypothetical protein|uniref:Anti-adapter protein IraM n=2 Tax=Tenebrionibacter/Tenebrionicola group TaxID=2969848 RepID=A0A8K0V4X5_9ENTR|nr:hypothetical protein [Tenebrionibacter intestinalis]MBV4413285.1 hypothetical protein [Tenebrionicola larvae]MBV5094227.1 hypothetical protein [Tenebrionicola larvae]